MFIASILWLTTSIYTLSVSSVNQGVLNLNDFSGKKIMFVNIASGSEYAATQLPQLEQLYQQFKDRFIIIAFPSNDFGNEESSNEDIMTNLVDRYGLSFPVSELYRVKGSYAQPVYHWIADQSENGVVSSEVAGDFQKYLLNNEGKIVAIYSGEVSPLDSSIQNAINEPY